MLFIFVAWIYTIFTNKQKKRTQIPQILIFFNKEYSVFLTFSVLLAGFHLLSSLSLNPTCPLPCPALPSPPPSHTHLPSRCDKDRQFPRFLHQRVWMGLSAVVRGDRFHRDLLKRQCAALALDSILWPSSGRSSVCPDHSADFFLAGSKPHCVFSSAYPVNAMWI